MAIEHKNNELKKLINELRKTSMEQKAPIWKSIAIELERPTRNRRIINLSKINRFSKDGEIVLVPGKVLGSGELDKKITVAAYSFSGQAEEKIKQAKGSSLNIYDLMKKNPKGKEIKVLG